MPIGYWIRLWLLALNPFTTYVKALKFIEEQKFVITPQSPDGSTQGFEELVVSGIRRTGDLRMDSLWEDRIRGRIFGYATLRIDSVSSRPGLRTCSITGNTYKLAAVAILGFRVLYGESQEAYPIGARGIGTCA